MTRAIILAAGQGTRLRPLTDDRPKCMVPLLGKPLIAWQTAALRDAGIEDIHVVAGYRADHIIGAGYDCTVNHDYASTNMVASLFTALPFIEREGDLLISYGDIVFESKNLSAVLSCEDEICVMIDQEWLRYWQLRLDDPLSDAETLQLDENGFILEVGKKPTDYDQIESQYTGLIKIRADAVPGFVNFYKALDPTAMYDGRDFDNMYMTSFLQLLIDAGWRVKGVPVENGWLEVDSVEDLRIYEKMATEGRLDRFCKLG